MIKNVVRDNVLNQKQINNSSLILSELFYLLSFKIKKWETYDLILHEKVWVHYLSIDGNNYPISREDYEILRSLGIDEIII